jgi:hypothetical protein
MEPTRKSRLMDRCESPQGRRDALAVAGAPFCVQQTGRSQQVHSLPTLFASHPMSPATQHIPLLPQSSWPPLISVSYLSRRIAAHQELRCLVDKSANMRDGDTCNVAPAMSLGVAQRAGMQLASKVATKDNQVVLAFKV